ncbi:MAG: ABC transporter ATP-binding protein [Candidatus Thorarchaeota archaeon]|jgi:oligopeptide/dipeptide ABC transporter ATP-binding protein
MEGPLFEVENLRAFIPSTKGPIVTVDDVTFSIREKECFGLLGESGCGKTSLLTAALGLFQITHRFKDAKIRSDWIYPFQLDYFDKEIWSKTVSGDVVYRGINLLSLSESERARYLGSHISYIPQGLQGALTPVFSIGEQTGEPLEIHNSDIRRSRMRDRVLEFLDLVNLAGADERYILDPGKFSGGEAQRILIAMALIAAPYLVIADEPTSALDVTVQAQVLGVLKMVKEEFNVGMMIVSHDASVIAEMADRVGVMYAGRIVEIGNSIQMFHDPKHPYTQGLMASYPTIAMLRMAAGKEKPKLRGIPGSPPDPREIPEGCSFHPRCPFIMSKCVEERPKLRTIESNHQIACHLE